MLSQTSEILKDWRSNIGIFKRMKKTEMMALIVKDRLKGNSVNDLL